MLSFVSSPTTAMPARNTSSTAAAGCQDRCQARHTCSKQIGEHFQAMFMIVAAMLMTSGIVLGQYLGAAMEQPWRPRRQELPVRRPLAWS